MWVGGYTMGNSANIIPRLEEELKNFKVHECEVYSRIVGYFRPVQQWNNGKQEEYGHRETFESFFKNT